MPEHITVFYDHALLKFWFVSGQSRNLQNIMAIQRIGNTLKVANSSNSIFIINFDNITIMEEVFTGDVIS
jgi:hypothetical protein